MSETEKAKFSEGEKEMGIMAKGKSKIGVIRLWAEAEIASYHIACSCSRSKWKRQTDRDRHIAAHCAGGSGDGVMVVRTRRGTSSENFGLNPKTKWKLLISLALILRSPSVLIPWFVPHWSTSFRRLYKGCCVKCAFAFALIRTYINCACACLYLCNFLYAFSSHFYSISINVFLHSFHLFISLFVFLSLCVSAVVGIVIINLLRNFFQSIKHTKC